MTAFLLAVLTVAALWYFWFRWRMKREAAGPRPAVEGDFEDLNEKFLRNEKRKEGTLDLVIVYQPDDLGLLRSLLDAEGIESYAPESPMGSLYPVSTIPGFTDATVSIYHGDAELARQVVRDYLEGYPQTSGEGRTPPKLID